MSAAPLLLPYDVPSVLELVVAWLVPLGDGVGPTRSADGPLPYRMVSLIDGDDDKVTDTALVSVHDFATGVSPEAALVAVEAQGATTRRRMLVLGPPLAAQQRVTLPSGLVVVVDGVECTQRPVPAAYGKNGLVARAVSRYRITQRFTAA